MRLVCPRCVAQYEVDDNAVPENGREVQCANCEHIWFQDSIQMLSEREPEDEKPDLTAESFRTGEADIFDDLDGVGDAQFRTARNDDAEADENTLNPEIDDEDDEPRELPEGIHKVDKDVLDVLRSEAAFSSARATHDPEPAEAEEEQDEADQDELTAYLDAHSDDEADATAEIADAGPEAEAADSAEDFDPLSDLDAIRTQLSDISEPEEESEYDPVLPQDDPEQADDYSDDPAGLTGAPDDAEDFEPEADDMEWEKDVPGSGYSAEIDEDDDLSTSDAPEVDDGEDEPSPKRAYRADLEDRGDPQEGPFEDDADLQQALSAAAQDDEYLDEEEEDQEKEEDLFDEEPDDPAGGSAIPAAAALGALRPRRTTSGVRPRTIPGAEALLGGLPAENAGAGVASGPVVPPGRPQQAGSSERTERPDTSGSRKELLPDVDELDSTLRNEAAKPRRDLESMGEVDEQPSGGFRRAFIWTLFIVALLAILYLYRPLIVELLPASAVVLDPYIEFVNGVRKGIDGIVEYLMQ